MITAISNQVIALCSFY